MPELYNNIRRANSQYVPQFTGSNAESLKSVADVLQTRSLQNQNAIDDSLVRVLNEKYAPGDEYIGQGIYEDVNNLREDLASSDAGFENSTGIIRNAVRDKVLTNRDRIEGLRNSQEYDKYQEQLRTLGADAVDFSRDKWKGTKNADGSYNRFMPDVQKRLEYDTQMEKFFNQMEASMHQSGYKPGKGELEDFLVSTVSGGIGDKRIDTYVKEAFNRYKDTSEYKQQARVMRELEGVPADQVDAHIKTQLLSTGLERAYGVSKIDLQRRYSYRDNPNNTTIAPPIFGGGRPGGVVPNEVNTPLTTNLAGSTNTVTDSDGKVYQFRDRKTGQIVENSENPLVASEGTDPLADIVYGANRIKQAEQNYEKVEIGNIDNYNRALNDELSKSYDKVQELETASGQKMFRDFKHYKESVAAGNERSKNVTPNGREISGGQAANYNNYINSDANLPLFVADKGEPMDLATMAKEIGTSPSNIKFEANKVFTDSPTRRLPGGYVEAKVIINDKDVKEHPTTVRIPLNLEAQALATNIDAVFKNSLYQGKDTFTAEVPFTPSIKGVPLMDKNKNKLAIWTTTYTEPIENQQEGKFPRTTIVHKGIVKPDGSVEKQEDMTIEQYKEDMYNLMSSYISGALNSGATYNLEDYKKRGLGN